MPTLNDLCQSIESRFPLCYQEQWDNSGIQVGRMGQEVSRVLCALEMSDAVLDEAIGLHCEAIVTHHPLLFHPVRSITDSSATGRLLLKAISNSIAIYSAHTSLDNAPDGINRLLADKLGLRGTTILCPMPEHPEAGAGVIGELPGELTEGQLLELVGKRWGISNLISGTGRGGTVKTVAICSGAGAFLAQQAIDKGADAYITADIKHHDYRDAENSIMLIDAGHYETEIFTKDILFDVISQKNRNFAVHLSKTEMPPRHF